MLLRTTMLHRFHWGNDANTVLFAALLASTQGNECGSAASGEVCVLTKKACGSVSKDEIGKVKVNSGWDCSTELCVKRTTAPSLCLLYGKLSCKRVMRLHNVVALGSVVLFQSVRHSDRQPPGMLCSQPGMASVFFPGLNL
ncbi:unnamed protein product [Mesocestoides corti]|uniref:Uncharacterized protein n=1 Tax=Mesocestoides corti TaxID=53468 RepID=A0A0R3UEK0_MESCO|nr:unnamed protein product [Mesocestoides corti]